MIWRHLALLAPGGTLSVLFFHRVFADVDPLMPGEPTARGFTQLLRWVQSQTTLLPLDAAVQALQQGRLPRAAASISFDDGYRDNHDVAAPILRRLGVPATFFVSTGFADGSVMWNDAVAEALRHVRTDVLVLPPEIGLPPLPVRSWHERGAALTMVLGKIKYFDEHARGDAVRAVVDACGAGAPAPLMMAPEQVRSLAEQGFGIGAHTVQHPILCTLPDADAAREISLGRQQLEAWTQRRVGLFAYPNGRAGRDYDARHVAMARAAGYDAAFTTEPGVASADSDLFQLPRFTPWRHDAEHSFRLQLMRNQWRRAPHRVPA